MGQGCGQQSPTPRFRVKEEDTGLQILDREARANHARDADQVFRAFAELQNGSGEDHPEKKRTPR